MSIPYHDKRQFRRHPTLIHASIMMPNGQFASCVVRNICQGGALIEVTNPKIMPVDFQLIVEADLFNANCEVCHRSPYAIGIHFRDLRIAHEGHDTRMVTATTADLQHFFPVAAGR